jgi:predicted component of type VI protein secretion system
MAANSFQITMRSGPVPGKTFPLKDESSLGRDLANDIVISDAEVSRRHARFYMREENVYIEDLGSTNGSFLNGERIATPQQLRKGDVITFGESVVMVFEKITQDADVTLITPPVTHAPEPVYPPPTYQPPYEPETYQPPAQPAPYYQPEPLRPTYEEESAEPILPERRRKPKRDGLPTWMIILIVAIVVIVCVIAVTLYFMPAAWWCGITFDMLAGCPLP